MERSPSRRCAADHDVHVLAKPEEEHQEPLRGEPRQAPARETTRGAKNWLYCGSDDGAHWNAVVVSLVASCQLHEVEPWAYLRDVLTLLPAWPVNRALELSPKHWNETRQKPEAQQLLASLRLLGRYDGSHATDTTPAT